MDAESLQRIREIRRKSPTRCRRDHLAIGPNRPVTVEVRSQQRCERTVPELRPEVRESFDVRIGTARLAKQGCESLRRDCVVAAGTYEVRKPEARKRCFNLPAQQGMPVGEQEVLRLTVALGDVVAEQAQHLVGERKRGRNAAALLLAADTPGVRAPCSIESQLHELPDLDAAAMYTPANRKQFAPGIDATGPHHRGEIGPPGARDVLENGVLGEHRQFRIGEVGQDVKYTEIIGAVQRFGNGKMVRRQDVFGSNQDRHAITQYPEVVVACERKYSTAARGQFEHPLRRTMPQECANAAEARCAAAYIECVGRERPADAGESFGLALCQRLGAMLGQQSVNERSRADDRCPAVSAGVFDDIDLVVVAHALSASGDAEQRLVGEPALQSVD